MEAEARGPNGAWGPDTSTWRPSPRALRAARSAADAHAPGHGRWRGHSPVATERPGLSLGSSLQLLLACQCQGQVGPVAVTSTRLRPTATSIVNPQPTSPSSQVPLRPPLRSAPAMAPAGDPPPATKYFWGDSPEPDEFYASQGLRHAESYFHTPHGRLFTHSFHPLSAAAKGVVFMTHGYGSDSSWLFQSIAISYARWGYAVFCADLLGHGRSDGLRGYLGDMEAAAAASLAFFLSVRRAHDYARLPAFLFGESMGAAAALLMYLRSPPAAGWTGLIFSAPLFAIPDDMYPSRALLFLYGLLFGLADTWAVLPDKKMVGRSIRDPERLKVIASNPRLYRGAPRVGTMRELARVTALLQASFGEVTAPFLAVHGTDDGVTSPEGSKMLYERAPSEDKELILYEGMYHSLIQGESDENRDRVLADMRKWIDERVRRYGPSVAVDAEGETQHDG